MRLKIMRKINLIAIIILPVIFLTSCLNIEPVKVGTVQDFSIGKITSKDVTVFFTVPIENPNKFSFVIPSQSGFSRPPKVYQLWDPRTG